MTTYPKWKVRYTGKLPCGNRKTLNMHVYAMSENQAISEAMVEIPKSFTKVQITTVQKLEQFRESPQPVVYQSRYVHRKG